MSAVELAIEKVKCLHEAHARQLLAWLQAHEPVAVVPTAPLGARAMLGFAGVCGLRPAPPPLAV